MSDRTITGARIAHRSFVSYIDKSREYYAASGYEHPYQWASHRDAPFVSLTKPLSSSRVGLVTTSSLIRDHDAGSAPVAPSKKTTYVAPADHVPAGMYTADLSWDKDATHTDDVGSFLPLDGLSAAAEQGRIGSVSPRFYGVPTDYSQRRTQEIDAPQIVAWCQEDEVDAVILVPL